jgi:small subunit ribosomal protein S3
MGQKVDPRIFRTGIIYGWSSKWFAKGHEYATFLRQDTEIKQYLRAKLKDAGLSGIEIQRTPQSLLVIVTVVRPGLIIGKGGAGVEVLREELHKKFFPTLKKATLQLNIVEVKNPNLAAPIVLRDIIIDLEKRLPYRRVMKQAIERVMKSGAQGVKVLLSGRLDGAEIARRETLHKGRFPLHTLRADIDYAAAPAFTIYGATGVKVWIYKGQVFSAKGGKANI